MRRLHHLGFILSLSLLLAACDFISSIDDPIDRVDADSLNVPSQVPFLITGVQHRLATTNSQISVQSSLLSDQFFFSTLVQNATFPTFQEIDLGQILLSNVTIRGSWRHATELRFLADDLIDRVENRIEFEEGQEDLIQQGLFTGYLYGAIARHIMATYFALDQTTPGGVIDAGPFIPAAELYADAANRYTTALDYAPSGYHERVTNSLLARTLLYSGDYSGAYAAAQDGMSPAWRLEEGPDDPPFQTLYSPGIPNDWFNDGGRGRTQIVADMRFFDEPDPRAPVEPATMTAAAQQQGIQYYRQARYIPSDAPITFISWQENNLMLAELALRGMGGESPLELVNENRAAASLGPLESVDLEILERERDYQLFTEGQRLPDQHRFDSWHLPAGAWQYLPIPDSERLTNPNL